MGEHPVVGEVFLYFQYVLHLFVVVGNLGKDGAVVLL
jgi:hypothetical protein